MRTNLIRRTHRMKSCAIFCFLVALNLIWVGQASSEGSRKYSLLSTEEARKIVTEIIQKDEPTIRSHLGGRLSLPKGGDLVVRGIRIDDKDYVVWAAAFTTGKVTEWTSHNNWENLAPKNLPAGGIPFILNGIFVTSVDLEVLNKPTRTTHTIKKGGYEWHVGPYGIMLINVYPIQRIFFDEPIKDFSEITTYVIEFSLFSKEGEGFAAHIKDKVIQFK